MIMRCKVTVDTSHYPKEGPWVLPEGWCWSTIDAISESILYGVSESAKNEGAYKLLRITDIQDNRVDWESVPYTDYDDAKVEQYLLRNNDILFARTGATVGKSYLSEKTPDNAIYASYLIRVRVNHLLNPQYIKCYFESGYYWDQIGANSVGVGQPNVNGTVLGSLSIPIPPLTEQERIVEKASNITQFIELLDMASDDLSNSVLKTKEKILDLAIHGKLVPQDPSEEPAIELLRSINPSFKASDNLHYGEALPKGWGLSTLGEISNYGRCISVPVTDIDDDAWVLELEDIERDSGHVIRRIAKKERVCNGTRNQFKKGQVLYSKLRTYLNKVSVAEADGFCTTEIIPIEPIEGVDPYYLNLVLRSPYFLDYTASCVYGVKMPRLGTNDARKAIIPLPPHKEQGRIVSTVRNLFSVIDQINGIVENCK